GAQPGREYQLHRRHRARERSSHCRRHGGDCRGPSASKVPPDLRAQVEVRIKHLESSFHGLPNLSQSFSFIFITAHGDIPTTVKAMKSAPSSSCQNHSALM